MVAFRVGIVGRFAFGKNQLNGQTIKTTIVSSVLAEIFGKENIHQVDTYGGVKALLRLPFRCIAALMKCQNVIMLPAYKGIRVIAPVLAIANFFTNRKLHYVVIGGWLDQFLRNKPWLQLCLKSFDGIYVETNSMKKQLESRGFTNIYVMPNFKNITPISPSELKYVAEEPFRLCTFSRVMLEKGIEDAVEAVKSVNEQYGRTVYTLDIYGQIDAAQTEWFNALKQTFPPYISYGGMVPFDKSVEVLKDYFALLFPTYYEGEGFAGTIIDAYSAGVPVIASDWKYNSELVSEDVGYLCPVKKARAMTELLKNIATDPELLIAKKQACLLEAEKYQPKNAIKPLLMRLDNGKVVHI